MAASNAQPFEISDFSGGITDHVFEQVMNRAAELDNFLIGHDKKPYMRWGSEVDDINNAGITTGERIGALINYANSDKLFYLSDKSIFYRNPSVFTELVGPSGNSVFSAGSLTSVGSFAQWNRHLYVTNDSLDARPMKIFKDDAGVYNVRSSGLPGLASTPTVTAGVAGDGSYLYAFIYAVDYTVFDLQYQTLGPVTETSVSNAEAPDVAAIQIAGIPVITNGTTENFDTANIKVFIYRTINGGTFFQKVGEVTNGTTTFNDSMSDEDLQNTGEVLYTNDGTVDYDQIPLHKFVHVVNNTGYFAHIKDDLGISPYKIRQSVPGIPDNAPIDFELSVDDEITGLNSVRSKPIVLCKKYIYRIDDFFDQFGRGSMTPVRISDTAGCISNNSCVQAENGLFWFGNEGIWYTDGYQTYKISDIADRYKKFIENTTQFNRIIGKFFEKERLIIWAIQTDSSHHENDAFLVLDLKWPTGIEQSTITTWSGNTFRPSALEIFDNKIYRGDTYGFTLVHKENLTSDAKVNRYKLASEWVNETIIWNLKTPHYNFGSTFFRKYPTKVLLTAADVGNTTIQVNAINDDGKSIRSCKPIRVRRDLVWDDDDFIWRVTDLVWRGEGLIEQWRRFPARSLRLSTLQLQITNGFSPITNSDAFGLATFSSPTVTLLSATLKWPRQSEDYYIYTEADNYTQGFLVTERTSDSVLTVRDPLGQLPTGDKKWVLRGYKKDEPLNLLSFNIHWTNVSQSQKAYSSDASSTGENA